VSNSLKTNYVRFGSNITLNATAAGAFPLTYQWFQNDSAIVDATNSSFVLANATIDDEGAYSIAVSNSYGEVHSRQGSVVVLVRPSIVVQPLDQRVVSNAAVSFSIRATGHPMPLGFRWRRNAVTYTNISIFGSNCFVTFPALSPDGTNSIVFSVAVTNLAGSILSSNAIVTFASDADLDGLPDDWEISHGFHPSDSADALRDDDHDGTSNLAEYLGGTDPRDPNDVLRLDLLSIDDAKWNATFHAQSNRTYTVQTAAHIGEPWRSLLSVLAAATNRTIQVTGGFDNANAIFRIKTPASP